MNEVRKNYVEYLQDCKRAESTLEQTLDVYDRIERTINKPWDKITDEDIDDFFEFGEIVNQKYNWKITKVRDGAQSTLDGYCKVFKDVYKCANHKKLGFKIKFTEKATKRRKFDYTRKFTKDPEDMCPGLKEMDKLISTLDKDHTVTQAFIIEALRQSGARSFELCNLKVSNVDIKNEEVLIETVKGGSTGRGRKRKVVLFDPEKFGKLFKEYLDKHRPEPASKKYKDILFITDKGKAYEPKQLYRFCTEITSEILGKSYSPHCFRRFAGSYWHYILDVKLSLVARMLGHFKEGGKTPNTKQTIEYIYEFEDTLHDAMKDARNRANNTHTATPQIETKQNLTELADLRKNNLISEETFKDLSMKMLG